ncbi:uncharacterized protein LOC142344508 [Convolutriloba macropyga]|uniref:uncharacterized protein LOC142344508 n=1 Tax=Convolutriloba macropyga TaxID=536237 RepID=UPI003F52210B
MRNYAKCGGVTRGCFLAPAGYLFCAYISIYCTFADRWSYKSIVIPDFLSYDSTTAGTFQVGTNSLNQYTETWTVGSSVTGIKEMTNNTQLFHKIVLYPSKPRHDLWNLETSDNSRTSSSTTLTFYFGLFHVCRHDMGKCYIYSFPETAHLKALFIAATYILLIASIFPIIIYQLRFSLKISNMTQIPLLMIHSILIIYVLGIYGRDNRARGHEMSWTYHISSSLCALPWIVWYWYTLEMGKERNRRATEQNDTEIITSQASNSSANGPNNYPQEPPEDYGWTGYQPIKPPSYQEVQRNINDYPLLDSSHAIPTSYRVTPERRTPPPSYTGITVDLPSYHSAVGTHGQAIRPLENETNINSSTPIADELQEHIC